MTKEAEFKTSQYRLGYLAALRDVYDILWRKHHDKRGFDRGLVDAIWEDIKKLDESLRSLNRE